MGVIKSIKKFVTDMLAPEAKTPGEREDALNTQIDRMVQQAQADNDKWGAVYQDGRDYIFGNQLTNIPHKRAMDRIQCNYIFPAIMQEQALITQRKPMIEVQPYELGDAPGAEVWKDVLQWQFDKGLDVPARLSEWIMDGKQYGFWVGKVWWDDKDSWDAEAQRWNGSVKVTVVPPNLFGMADAASIDEAKYAYTKRRMDLDEAKATWPKFAAQLEAEQDRDDGTEEAAGGFLVTGMGSKSALDSSEANGEEGQAIQHNKEQEGRLSRLLSGQGAYGRVEAEGNATPTVTVLEIFIRDFSTQKVKTTETISYDELIESGQVAIQDTPAGPVYAHAVTGEPLNEQNHPTRDNEHEAPMFPNGRRILRVGRTILNPEIEDQVWQYKRWPFIIGHNVQLPHTWRGLNAVELAKSQQDSVNVVAAHLREWLKSFGDPLVKVEEGALQNCQDNRNVKRHIESNIWKMAQGKLGSAVREPATSLSQGALELFQLSIKETQNATGVHEIAMGQQATGGITATEAGALETNTRLRTALQGVLVDRFIVSLMEAVHEVCAKNMTVGDEVRIIGQAKAASVIAVSQEMLDARFDLKLSVASALPFDRERRKNDALTLFKIVGRPYLEKVLQAFEVDDIPALMQEIQAFEMQQQQAAMNQSIMQAGGGQSMPQQAQA